MKRSKFSAGQVTAVLRENEVGAKVDGLYRRHGIPPATSHAWRKTVGGLDVSEAKRLRDLEAGNARLKRIVADQMLEMSAMTEPFLAKKLLTPRAKRRAVGFLMGDPGPGRAAGLPDRRRLDPGHATGTMSRRAGRRPEPPAQDRARPSEDDRSDLLRRRGHDLPSFAMIRSRRIIHRRKGRWSEDQRGQAAEGPEGTSRAMVEWSARPGVRRHLIEPAKPLQNAFVESFNDRVRGECLNRHCFRWLRQAQKEIAA